MIDIGRQVSKQEALVFFNLFGNFDWAIRTAAHQRCVSHGFEVQNLPLAPSTLWVRAKGQLDSPAHRRNLLTFREAKLH